MALVANNQADQDPDKIIMIDDGTGVSIAIPTVIITKDVGDAIKKAVLDCEENNENPTKSKCFVVLLVDFEMENPDDRVEYDIWYTSGDTNALAYIISMRSYNQKLGKNALMTPHIIVRTCSYCIDTDPDCRRYGNTMYCAGFSDNFNITGRDSLSLGVDELCVYDIYKDIDTEMWWTYMQEVFRCRKERYSQQCLDNIQTYLGIDSSKLLACKYKEKDIIEKEAENWSFSGIPYSPAVVINNRVFRVTYLNIIGHT
jgi:hypothetical protein